MAFHQLVLEDLTVPQLQVVAEQRNGKGFHVHYTGGFDASRKNFRLACPGYLVSGCVLTTVFQYPAPSGLKGQQNDTYPVFLGQYNDFRKTYVKFHFAGKDELKVERRYKGNKSLLLTRRSKNVEGIHVLEFVRELLNLKVYLDGELLLPARTITDGSDIDAHVVLGTEDDLTYCPFVFYESHYTMPNVEAVFKIPAFFNKNLDYCFPHKNLEVAAGGYILWYASWTPGADVAAENYRGDRFAGSVRNPQLGDLRLLLKVYESGCTLSDANDSSSVPSLARNVKSVDLNGVLVRPNPVSFYEFKAVTGQITY